jgi:hypothetical protein
MKIYQPTVLNTLEPYSGATPWGMPEFTLVPEQTKVQTNSLSPTVNLAEKSVQGLEIVTESVVQPTVKPWYKSPLYIAAVAVAAYFAAKKFKLIK